MSEAADRLSLALSEQATFNIFSPADEDQIRVGYISTERGYIKASRDVRQMNMPS